MKTHSGHPRGYLRAIKRALWCVLFAVAICAHGAEPAPLERLADACRRSDLEEVQKLLGDGALDQAALARPTPERTVLHYAVQGRASRQPARLAVVTALLDHGAPLNAAAKNGESVFEAAVEPGWDKALLELLLARGADLNTAAPKSAGGPALHRAAARFDLELVTFLLLHKADPNLPHPVDRDTPLMRIFGGHTGVWEWQLFSAERLRTAAFQTMRVLLDHGADLQRTNQRGETVLHRAAGANHLQCVQELVSRGAAADARTTDGRTVLHYAASNEKYHERAVLQTLLTLSRLPVDVADNAGNTPLHRAVRTSSSLATQSLLLLGANPAVRNREQKRPDEMEGHDRLDAATRDMLRRYLPADEPPRQPEVPSGTGAAPTTVALRR